MWHQEPSVLPEYPDLLQQPCICCLENFSLGKSAHCHQDLGDNKDNKSSSAEKLPYTLKESRDATSRSFHELYSGFILHSMKAYRTCRGKYYPCRNLVGLHTWVQCSHRVGVEWNPKEGIRSPGAGVTSTCESPYAGAENQTQVLLQEQQALLSAEKSPPPPSLRLLVMFSPHAFPVGEEVLLTFVEN